MRIWPGRNRPFYGWTIVGALSLTETVSWGVLYYAFSVFLVPMGDEFGWSTAAMTGAYSLALLLSGIAAPFVGRWLDLRGPRALMTTASILGALLVLAWSRVDGMLAFYVIWAGIGIVMSATLYEPAFATVTTWFERDRPRAILAVTIVAGFASTIFLPLSAWLVAWLGWRDALLVLAMLLAVLTIPPHALILRRRPEDCGLLPDGVGPGEIEPGHESRVIRSGVDLRSALRDRAFWWLAIGFSLETFAAAAVALHLIPYLTTRGDGARFAATAAGLIGAAQVLARILATMVGGRVSQVALTSAVFALQAVAVTVLLEWQSRAGVLTAVLLLGAGRGVVTLMRAGLIADFYGRAHFGSINGALAFVLTGSRAVAPVAAGLALAGFNSYRPVLWAMATCSLLAAGAMVRVGVARPGQRAPWPLVTA